MQAKTGTPVALTPGNKGEFTVLAGESVLWDKGKAGRFPEEEEVLVQLTQG
ncbi:MAG: Rdx family [Planctomycetota bacterium]|jgi:predicted Rdx family selenoprotein